MLIVICILGLILSVGVGFFLCWLRIRRQRADSVVQTLAFIVGQNLPLINGLQAAASAERGVLRRRLRRISERLALGDPLATAVQVADLSCPGQIIGTLAAAERAGTLPTVLRSLAADARRDRARTPVLVSPYVYGLGLLVLVSLVLLFVGAVVFPKIQIIYEDFGIAPPAGTRWLIAIGEPFSPGITAFIGGAAVLLVLQIAFVRHFVPRTARKPGPIAILFDIIAWCLPFVHQLAARKAAAQQLPVLSAAVAAGRPLHEAALEAATIPVNECARSRLRRWAGLMESGTPPATAARAADLPNAWIQTLQATAMSSASLSAGLEYLTVANRASLTYWQRMMTAILTPTIVIVWGVGIGVVVYNLFMPMIVILEGVLRAIE